MLVTAEGWSDEKWGAKKIHGNKEVCVGFDGVASWSWRPWV